MRSIARRVSSGPPFAGRPVSMNSFRSGYDAGSELKSGRFAASAGSASLIVRISTTVDAAARVDADRRVDEIGAAQRDTAARCAAARTRRPASAR